MQTGEVAPSTPVWGQVALAGTTIVLAVLMVDAAVETVLGSSPSRWIVMGAVAILAALAVLFQRRWGWTASLSTTLLGLLALLTLTAWLPGGLEHGVVLLRQPTTVVLSAACAAALVLAAGVFAPDRRLPLVARAPLVLVAVYGAAAFGLGALREVPFSQLLHGASLWDRLPFWLQGAWVGGLVVMPAALLVQVSASFRAGSVMKSLVGGSAWALLIGLVVAGLRAPPPAAVPYPASPAAAPQQAPLAGPRTLPPGSAASAEKAQAQYQQELAKLKAAVDESALSVPALQAKLGADPRTLAKFVQTETRFEAYPGALRGARGALLARSGNSLDRALLLQALLRSAGHKARLAEGSLSRPQAEQLVLSGFSAGKPPLTGGRQQEIVDKARAQLVQLDDALKAAGFHAPTGDAGRWDRSVEEAQRHFWVRLDADGRRTEIDPSPGVPYGESLVQATGDRDEPDPGSVHRLELRIESDEMRDGRPVTTTLLEYAASTGELSGVPIGFFHEVSGDAATPVLMVGDKLHRGRSARSAATLWGAGGTNVLNPFEAGAGQGLRAERLRFRVSGPSGERTGAYSIVEAGQTSVESDSAVNEALGAFFGLTVTTGAIPIDLPMAILAEARDPSSDEAAVRILATTGLLYHVVRGGVPASLSDTPPVQYPDSANVIIVRVQPAKQTDKVAVSMDLALKAHRNLRRPGDQLLGRGVFYDELSAGVLDHTVERALFGPGWTSESVGSLFEKAASERVGLRVLRASSEAPRTFLTERGQRRLAADLARGQLVILPESRVADWKSVSGWWSIDPATGWTEDNNEDGYHTEAEDSAIKVFINHRGFKVFCALGTTVSFVVSSYVDEGRFKKAAASGAGATGALCAWAGAAR